jgi:hypothetical protein
LGKPQTVELPTTDRNSIQQTVRRERCCAAQTLLAAQVLDHTAGTHHQNLFQAGREGDLGTDMAIGIDLEGLALVDDNEPSITREASRPAFARVSADEPEQ